MLLKTKRGGKAKNIIALILALSALLVCVSCAPDDIDISGYADETISLEGLSEGAIQMSVEDLKEMECVTVKTESTSDKIGKVRATGPTMETVLSNYGVDMADIKKIRFYGKDDYNYSLNSDYIMEHDIILAFGIDGEPLDEESAPVRIIIPKSDSAYWIRMVERIEFVK